MRLDIRLLGPVEVTVDRQAVQLAGRQRTLLAVLSLSSGRTVSIDRIVAATWGQRLPDNPRGSVQTYVTRLRRLLGAGAIGTEAAGYVLRAVPDEVDVLRFLRLLDSAGSVGDAEAERDRLDSALSLWRGAPFEGVASPWLQETEVPRLVERYLAAIERLADLDIADGRFDGLAGRLREVVSQHPLRESLWARLLVVLDSGGRHAEALEAYETVRRRLAEELGTDPGPELRSLHARLLSANAPLSSPPPSNPPSSSPASSSPAPSRPPPRGLSPRLERLPAGAVVPRQLPADVSGFTGRHDELSRLDKLLGEEPSRLVVTAISGAAGIGKTTLAVHWAHRVADRFPDGQLYVNLRGFDPSGSPRHPQDVVRGFLDALQVPAQRVPADADVQTGLFRSLVAGRRMLVVLDNAHDADQVRPLLPGAPGCLVVVTSRDRMLSLIAAEGAHPVMLDLPSVDEARQMLARRLGHDRVSAEARAVDEIIVASARLPLALAVVAARAAANPEFRLEALAADLRRGLDAFDAASAVTDIRSVFSWSHRTLSPEAARLFRLLGLHPGPDLTVPAAGGLAGVPVPRARSLLNELTRAHLITEHQPGRYTFHDLLRAYAVELAHLLEPTSDRHVALHRILDHYLRTAYSAALLVNPHRDRIGLTSIQTESEGEVLDDSRMAMDWFASEYAVLLAAAEEAAALGWDAKAWELAWTLTTFFGRKGLWHDWVTAQQLALEAAERLSDAAKIALAHADLGRAKGRLGRAEDAEAHMRQAVGIYRELADPAGEAHVQINLCNLFERQGRYREALQHARQGLDLFLRTGNQNAIARATNNLGWCHALLGDYEQALVHCGRALALHQRCGDAFGQAATWDSLGYAHQRLASFDQAVTCYRRAFALYREAGDTYNQAEILLHLADAHHETGEAVAAHAARARALRILEEIGHPRAEQVRAGLAGPESVLKVN